MNSIVFMPRIVPHYGGGGNFSGLPSVLLTCAIVGVILIVIGILANALHTKLSQGFTYNQIRWADIKPGIDNTLVGFFCGVLGFAFIAGASILGLVVGVYWFVITL